MECLHCGDCCLRMSPLTAPDPCPFIEQQGDFYFCGQYHKRPDPCIDHSFNYRFCPIGMSKLDLQTHEQVQNRLKIANIKLMDYYNVHTN